MNKGEALERILREMPLLQSEIARMQRIAFIPADRSEGATVLRQSWYVRGFVETWLMALRKGEDFKGITIPLKEEEDSILVQLRQQIPLGLEGLQRKVLTDTLGGMQANLRHIVYLLREGELYDHAQKAISILATWVTLIAEMN